MFSAIEQIECSFRSIWAHQMALNHGSHPHLDVDLAKDRKDWTQNIQSLINETSRSNEAFIKHFMAKYSEILPPIWASCEVMSLGQLSRWYQSLQSLQTSQSISRMYLLNNKLLESWIHSISIVRNHCAHHSRLWNREFTVTPAEPTSQHNPLPPIWNRGSRKIYNILLVVIFFLDQIESGNSWKSELKQLIAQHSITTSSMGFPPNWQSHSFWQ
jgi:abortive infection bacteriophage resistance protein